MKDEKLKLVVIGISHRTASISELEAFQLTKTELNSALDYLKSMDGIAGITIISTCNRVEFYLALKNNFDSLDIIKKFYLDEKRIDVFERKENFYNYTDGDAANHLFKVICGFDSMVLGEYQIQGQIKEAYSIACSEKAADKILHKLFHAAFRVGKSVRSKTKIGSGKQSVSGIAFQILQEKLNKNDSIALVGVNQNTKIIAEKLSAAGYSNFVFVNRTRYKAEKLADQYSGCAFDLENIQEAISNVSCIFSCTGAQDFIVQSGIINSVYIKSNQLKLIIDIAVPRDVETIGIPKAIQVFDLEELKNYLKNKQKEILLDLPIANEIIEDEVELFKAWIESQSDETMAYYDEKIELLRLQYLNEIKEQLSYEDYRAFDKFSKSLLHRIKSTVHQVVKTNKSDKIAS
ncbi:MAG: glutamyl-tRNA reductase [Ignavibacteria bacterium]|nr:glutamyl-tRNA reductase [Ignavibacteria bacterium]MBT8381187.1 glutamyl-tRNA reductase [Ignavibacteria bacterium]MBT8392980.1 glutamyl-tRNA reductase [Ignavibacteria bacterium]NNJ53864.1 glutamyl-tRNA reductase [Ignavibacteriaceae bacterium]NNL22603.1 glutamyl-tRNA reductase [Ignavibacteriaceae bacterium]